MLLPAVMALSANALLLLAMVTIYDLVTAKLRPALRGRRDAVLGILLGAIGIDRAKALIEEAASWGRVFGVVK